MTQEFNQELAQVYRAHSGKILARLVALGHDLQLAEDALQEACIQAQEVRQESIRDLAAWLYTTSKRRLIDRLRSSKRHGRDSVLQEALTQLHNEVSYEAQQEIPDERLKLMFTCCHPALSEQARVALTLKTLSGLTTREIARAFLVSDSTMHQRLLRAKQKIKANQLPYRVPEGDDLAARLDSVLSVIYLIYNESYTAFEGQSLTRDDLAKEALRLAELVNSLLPGGETCGLLCLIQLHQSRRLARTQSPLGLVPLSDQDRTCWDRALIDDASQRLLLTLAKGQPGPYQVQAAISAVHAHAPSWEETDWAEIIGLYLRLADYRPGPVTELNRLAAVSHSGASELALRGLLQLAPSLENYQPYHATLADVYEQIEQWDHARIALTSALRLTHNAVEKEFLKNKLKRLKKSQALSQADLD